MSAFKPVRVAVVAIVSIGASSHATSIGCETQTTGDMLLRAERVFTGRLTTMEFLEPNDSGVEPAVLLTFTVHRNYKGEGVVLVFRSTLNKWTGRGYTWQEGARYLIFGRVIDGQLAAGSCSIFPIPDDGREPMETSRVLAELDEIVCPPPEVTIGL